MTENYDDLSATEVIDTTEDADQKAGVTPVTSEPDQQPEDSEGAPTDGREAAKYRRRLREAEAERDTLAAKVAAMQTAEAERLATAAKVKPEALWAATGLEALLSDDGTIDPKKFDMAIQSAREKFGLPDPRYGNVVPNEGRAPSTTGSGSNWESAFRASR